ncbi:hypothetical protein AB0K34_13670 [Actinomadura sp. NPDC049382]|uniref:hypothetical protein n=1 Tax=Actinomadura sp. NPDC049382 TaxID=3158220 RepID=UPI0034220922
MSIYSTWLTIDDNDHATHCAVYERMPAGDDWPDGAVMVAGGIFYRRTEQACTCGNPPPLVYQGSHVNPSQDGPRGGGVDVAAIPNHCHPQVRGTLTDDGPPVEFVRLSVAEDETTYGGPQPGYAQVVLDRAQVERLRDTLTNWLDTRERW